MKKTFIFPLTDDIQVMIEALTFREAQEEYITIRHESEDVKVEVVKASPKKILKKGLYEYLLELRSGGFFELPRTLSDIKDKLSELALNYPVTSFPPYLNRLVRERELTRKKIDKDKKKVWAYQGQNGK